MSDRPAPTPHAPHLQSFSSLTRATFRLIGDHFVILLTATAIPIMVAYLGVMIIVGMFVADFNDVQTYEDLVGILTFQNNFLYYAIVISVIVLFVNIIGAIAAPLSLIKNDAVTIKNVFQKSIVYVLSFVVMLLITGLLGLLIMVLVNVLLFAILVVVGIFNGNLIFDTYLSVSEWLSPISVLVPSFLVSFAPFIIIAEDTSGMQAVKKSIMMIVRNFWAVLIRLGILAIVLASISFVFVYIPVVGTSFSALASAMLATAFTYALYRDLQGKPVADSSTK